MDQALNIPSIESAITGPEVTLLPHNHSVDRGRSIEVPFALGYRGSLPLLREQSISTNQLRLHRCRWNVPRRERSIRHHICAS